MDLISGQPLWPVAVGLPACYPALRSDLECEVAVLGAGITGALVAHRFAADGIDVVVVDRSEVGHGSTFALATAPLSPTFDWGENRCLVWEAARPYTYPSSSYDGRLVAGGEDLAFASSHRRGRQLERQTRQLERRLRRLLPAADFTVDWRWAGTFAETRDGLPLIGRSDAFRRGYFALGYGGNGITFGAVAARLLLDLHRRRANPDLALFRLDRPAR